MLWFRYEMPPKAHVSDNARIFRGEIILLCEVSPNQWIKII